MNANYKNWVPKGMVVGLTTGTAILAVGTAAALCCDVVPPTAKKLLVGTLGVGALGCGVMAA